MEIYQIVGFGSDFHPDGSYESRQDPIRASCHKVPAIRKLSIFYSFCFRI